MMMMTKVRAKSKGFYGGRRILSGEEFVLEPGRSIGKWMEIVGEPEEEIPEPQLGVVIEQDTDPTMEETPGNQQGQNGTNGRATKPVSAIRQFCIGCVGGSGNGRKPLKQVRKCPVVECPLHPFRMGRNPFDKRNLTETQRKAKADLIGAVHFPDNLS